MVLTRRIDAAGIWASGAIPSGGIGVRAATPHLNRASSSGGGHHPTGGRGNGTVVIENRQNHRLQHDGLGKRRLDGEDRARWKIDLAFGIAPHISGEPERRKPGQGVARQAEAAQEVNVVGAEPKRFDCLEHPCRARHHAITAARRKTTGKDLKN